MPARRFLPALALLSSAPFTTTRKPHHALPAVIPNPNVARAGVLRAGILIVTLEAKKPAGWRTARNAHQ